MRVLVVDDSKDTADSFALLLQLQGVEVRVCYDGPSVLAAAQEFAPRVVALDLGLPGQDGWEVAKQLKALARAPFVLAVSGHARDEDRKKSAAAHIDLHLAKPADPQFIVTLLQRLKAAN